MVLGRGPSDRVTRTVANEYTPVQRLFLDQNPSPVLAIMVYVHRSCLFKDILELSAQRALLQAYKLRQLDRRCRWVDHHSTVGDQHKLPQLSHSTPPPHRPPNSPSEPSPP